MITLKCQCCGVVQIFTSPLEAFEKGWDCPPYFTQVVCCDLCPASFVVLGIPHTASHERWEREGRPKEFQIPIGLIE
jgi:hypothetical protein